MTRTLVAGSYPPVPGPAAAATLQAVRDELASGVEVDVLSPRPGAAHHHADLRGWRGARALARQQRISGADTLVLCVEPGVPFSEGLPPWRVRVEAALVVALTRRFRRLVILAPTGLDPGGDAARSLWARADLVVVPEDRRAATAATAGVRHGRVVDTPEASRAGEIVVGTSVVAADGDGAAAPIVVARSTATVYGPLPPRAPAREVVRSLPTRTVAAFDRRASRLARVVLGDRAGVVGRPLRALVRPVRRAADWAARPRRAR